MEEGRRKQEVRRRKRGKEKKVRRRRKRGREKRGYLERHCWGAKYYKERIRKRKEKGIIDKWK